jgi:hypothetical protein
MTKRTSFILTVLSGYGIMRAINIPRAAARIQMMTLPAIYMAAARYRPDSNKPSA